MSASSPPRIRRGFTLAELTVSIAITSLLLVSIASAVMIATRAIPDRRNPASHATGVAAALAQISEELGSAMHVIEATAQSVAFTVADRADADFSPETIRYAWSGTPGDPLTREYNNDPAMTVLPDVHQLNLGYTIATSSEPYEATSVEGAEAVLFSYDSSSNPNPAAVGVTSTQWPGQYFKPASIVGSKTWSISRIQFCAQVSGTDTTGTTNVQLRLPEHATSVLPGETVIDQAAVAESSLGVLTSSWKEVTFTKSRGLSPSQGLAVVFVTTGSDSMMLDYYSGGVSGSNAGFLLGPTWTAASDKSLRLYAYGRKIAPPAGAAPNLWTRRQLTRIGVVLSAGPSAASAINASTAIHTPNRPQVGGMFIETDFRSDPTAVDSDGDGVGDWVVRGGSPFNGASLTSGVWTADTTLDSAPGNDFQTPTEVAVRFRNTSVGGEGAQVLVNFARSTSKVAPVLASLQRQPDGTQKLTVYRKSASGLNVPLIQVDHLPATFITMRLMFDPVLQTVNIRVNGWDVGTFIYFRQTPTDTNRFITLLSSGSTSEFDHASVRVWTGL